MAEGQNAASKGEWENMKTALYARVSTTDHGQDVELQLTDLRKYAEARGWTIHKEYIDEGWSGAKDKRPALDELMRDARKRKVDVILVWRLDRFGRSMRHLILSLDELQALGVGFVSYKESLDLTTPTGRLMVHLLSAFAEFEREVIKERVKAGIVHARAKGVKIGRPACEVDRDAGIGLRDSGLSIRGIAKEMGLDKSLVLRTLHGVSKPSEIEATLTQ
jgi:putative DNA-invertase from lambdoid prophage Rac